MKNKWVAVLVVAVFLCVAGGLSAQTSQSEGEVASVQSSTFSLASGEGFNVSSTTTVIINGSQAAYSSLAPGMTALVDWTKCRSKNGLPCASQITAKGDTKTTTTSVANGIIGSLAKSYFTFLNGTTFLVNSSTQVSYNGKATTYSSLTTGLEASVSFADCGAKYPCASSIAASDPTLQKK
jgi:hypothetical protein